MNKTSILLLALALCLALTHSEGCNNNCETTTEGCCVCSTDLNFCYSCRPGYSYNDGSCQKNNCQDANCKLCDSDGTCFSCKLSYQIDQSHHCNAINCGANCQVCIDNPVSCVRCNQGFTLSQGNCQWFDYSHFTTFPIQIAIVS